jgi:hypothetical protein
LGQKVSYLNLPKSIELLLHTYLQARRSNDFRKIGAKSVLPKLAEIFSQNLLIYYTPWATLGLPRATFWLPWACFGVLRLPWACLGVLGRAWACLGVLRLPWACLGYSWDNLSLRLNICRRYNFKTATHCGLKNQKKLTECLSHLP